MTQEFPSNARGVERENPLAPNPASAPTVKTEEDKGIKQIVEGGVKKRKTPLHRRFVQTFMGGDVKSVKDYVVLDVIVPAIKDTIANAATETVERALFGEARSRRRIGGIGGFPGGIFQSTNYNAMSSGVAARREDPRETINRRARATQDFGQLQFQSREAAETVIFEMAKVIQEWGVVTVADLYTMVGEEKDYTANKFGWTDLRGAGVSGSHGRGFNIDLPTPQQI